MALKWKRGAGVAVGVAAAVLVLAGLAALAFSLSAMQASLPALSAHADRAGAPAPAFSSKAVAMEAAPGVAGASSAAPGRDPVLARIEEGERVKTKRGSAVLEVPRGGLDAALERVRARVADAGGLVESVNFRQTRSGAHYQLTVRLPPEAFDGFALGLRELGTLRSLETSVEDVTTAYVDLVARIESLQRQRDRLQALADRPGTGLDELLRLERELARVQAELESLEASRRNLSRRVSMATLSLRIQEPAPVLDAAVLEPLGQAANLFFGAFSSGTLVLAGVGGFLLPFAVAGALAWRAWRWLKRRGPGRGSARSVADAVKP